MESNRVSIENLEQGVRIAAKIVTLYGELYLPIFTRIHAELIKEKEKAEMQKRAFELAKTYLPIDTT